MCPEVEAWVDPTIGSDVTGSINDPALPYKQLQSAIDAVILHLDSIHSTTSNAKGLVYAMPGLYGPYTNGSGDNFPIEMRDRVNVIGMNSRACVLRYKSDVGNQPKSIFWPDQAAIGNFPFSASILVDWSTATNGAPLPGGSGTTPPAWVGDADYAEFLDGFTLEGADVQIYAGDTRGQPLYLSGRISNCVFDMRDGWTPEDEASTLAGPWFGVMVVSTIDITYSCGYWDKHFVIANNTFVMAQYGRSSPAASPAWIHQSRDEAVGIIDVNDPYCLGANSDPDPFLRGMSNLVVLNNLFRTRPDTSNVKPMAMLGIDDGDTLAAIGSGTPRETNAFAVGRAGTHNNYFYSNVATSFVVNPTLPIVYCGASPCQGAGTPCVPSSTSCVSASAPTTARALWNGATGEFDPGFVGEFLNLTNQITFPLGQSFYVYRDWRLLPGSPMADLGIAATAPNGSPVVTNNGRAVYTHACDALNTFFRDGEKYGNPRVVGSSIDVGFDEIGSLILAGSWANDSHSHNTPTPLLANSSQGLATRFFILPELFKGPLTKLAINGTQNILSGPPYSPNAWTQPPATLRAPVVDSNLPADYRSRFISYGNPSSQNVPTAWCWNNPTPPTNGCKVSQTIPTTLLPYEPLLNVTNQPDLYFVVLSVPDSESSNLAAYFNVQAVVENDSTSSGLTRWTNLQSEYR